MKSLIVILMIVLFFLAYFVLDFVGFKYIGIVPNSVAATATTIALFISVVILGCILYHKWITRHSKNGQSSSPDSSCEDRPWIKIIKYFESSGFVVLILSAFLIVSIVHTTQVEQDIEEKDKYIEQLEEYAVDEYERGCEDGQYVNKEIYDESYSSGYCEGEQDGYCFGHEEGYVEGYKDAQNGEDPIYVIDG